MSSWLENLFSCQFNCISYLDLCVLHNSDDCYSNIKLICQSVQIKQSKFDSGLSNSFFFLQFPPEWETLELLEAVKPVLLYCVIEVFNILGKKRHALMLASYSMKNKIYQSFSCIIYRHSISLSAVEAMIVQCTLGYGIHHGTEANGLHKQEWPD